MSRRPLKFDWSALEGRYEPIPWSGCWIWMGPSSKAGYGSVQLHYQKWSAHRLAYALTFGIPPADLVVCHQCDIPACINPAHLFLGTRLDNALDASRKGRLLKTRPQIEHICLDCGNAFSGEAIAVYCSRQCRMRAKARRYYQRHQHAAPPK